MGEDTDLTPTLDDLATDSLELSPVWCGWCPEEETQVIQDLSAEVDAITAVNEHNTSTGHAAVVTLSLPNAVAVNADIQLLPFPFCFRYNGRPWQSVIVKAPGPDEAATTAEQIVGVLNLSATRRGFPALFSATGGPCPIA
ncbi:hypothetical protein ACFZA1_40320 [Streptomyces filipinensis]|uniref:hypothetical protein n=1 Tax=Streptomyces filipinensis TaxID=66887 RepID=UPI0036EE3F74